MIAVLLRLIIICLITSTAIWAVAKNSSQFSILINKPLDGLISSVESTPIFVQGKLSNLVKERKWNDVVTLSSKVLTENVGYEGSFKFWYYKALGECALLKIESCAKSCLNASIFAGDKYRSSIERMQQFLGLFRSSQSKEEEAIQQNSLLI